MNGLQTRSLNTTTWRKKNDIQDPSGIKINLSTWSIGWHANYINYQRRLTCLFLKLFWKPNTVVITEAGDQACMSWGSWKLEQQTRGVRSFMGGKIIFPGLWLPSTKSDWSYILETFNRLALASSSEPAVEVFFFYWRDVLTATCTTIVSQPLLYWVRHHFGGWVQIVNKLFLHMDQWKLNKVY